MKTQTHVFERVCTIVQLPTDNTHLIFSF